MQRFTRRSAEAPLGICWVGGRGGASGSSGASRGKAVLGQPAH